MLYNRRERQTPLMSEKCVLGNINCPSFTPPTKLKLRKLDSLPCTTTLLQAQLTINNFAKMSGHYQDEHDHSGHDHGHDHAGHDHTDDITPALQYSLYQHINFDDITTLNESSSHSGKAVVKKTWAERLEPVPELESDADEQLLMHIPCVCFLTYASSRD